MAELTMHVIGEARESRRPDSPVERMRTETPQAYDVYLCGKCGIILVRGLSGEALGDCVIRCPNCEALNTP